MYCAEWMKNPPVSKEFLEVLDQFWLFEKKYRLILKVLEKLLLIGVVSLLTYIFLSDSEYGAVIAVISICALYLIYENMVRIRKKHYQGVITILQDLAAARPRELTK
jgi:hypothetical protein